MSDQQQILRLLATIREEVAGIRSRQEELYEILLSYKDQIHEVHQTVQEGLAGLPTSPYIAGQLVPAPDQLDGVDDFTQALAAFLHRAPLTPADTPPRDVDMTPAPDPKDEEIELEPSEDGPSRRRSRNGGGGKGRPRDMDLERGPDRDVELLDLDDEDDDEDDDDDEAKPAKKKRRRGRRKRSKKSGSKSEAD